MEHCITTTKLAAINIDRAHMHYYSMLSHIAAAQVSVCTSVLSQRQAQYLLSTSTKPMYTRLLSVQRINMVKKMMIVKLHLAGFLEWLEVRGPWHFLLWHIMTCNEVFVIRVNNLLPHLICIENEQMIAACALLVTL